MLEKIDLNKKMSKQEYSESLPKIEAELRRLQRECKDLDIPVMIVFEGFGASGKGLQIGKLIHSMDREDLRCIRLKMRRKKNGCIRFCGGFGSNSEKRKSGF